MSKKTFIGWNSLSRKLEARKIKKAEMGAAYRLRYEVFHNELNWISRNGIGEDVDIYDNAAMHFGVFLDSDILGYVRVILSQNSSILEHNFEALLRNKSLLYEEDNAVELSRLAVKNSRDAIFRFEIAMLLYKSVYFWSLKSKVRYWCMEISSLYLKSLQKLFPCKQIGNTQYYKIGIPTAIAILDLREAEEFLFKKNLSFYRWFVSKPYSKLKAKPKKFNARKPDYI